ncbi:MAG: TetR/AcrR family transcriptional regulator [Deltaproteobacteria bacterium]|nr:MAG: TetR/AcrR family transcriptional regulator [Deltaproteobacteria bacterium]
MPRVVDKQKKAAEIADAALEVFRQRGYHATRMTDVAEAAGVGKGTLYEYFRNKADILHASFDSFFEAFEQGALEAIGNAGGPGDRLLALVRFALSHVREWERHCSVYVDYFGVQRDERDGPFSLSAFYDRFGALLGQLVEQAQSAGEIRREFDPRLVAELLLAMYDGVILHRIFHGHERRSDELIPTALSILAAGLLASESHG